MEKSKLEFQTILGTALLILSILCASCGVKGPPLPPISATPATPEEKSLGRKPTPVLPLPSAVQSPKPKGE